MKKRTLMLVLALSASLLMAVTGTLAYLTDTDSDVNVMTLGNVEIDQLENGKSEGGFETQPLYPAYVNGTEVTGKLEKAVTVKNTGKSEAYVRTWIALEAGNLSATDFVKVIHADIDDTKYTLSVPQIVDIEGVKYYVVCATYNDKLAEGETTKAPSLKSVYMDPTANNAEVAMFGNTYEILVFSQAVQTANMETIGAAAALSAGFGDAHPWVGGVDILPTKTVKTADDLRAALAEGGTTVVLANDVELDADETITIAKGKNVRLDLAGHTLSGVSNVTGANRNMIDVNGGTLTVNNGKMEIEHTGANMGWNNSTNIFNITAGGVLNLNGVTAVNKGGSDMAFVAHLNNWGEVTLNVNDSDLQSSYIAVRAFNSGYDMNNISVHNSTLAGKYSLWVHNYTLADFGNDQAKHEAAKARLNFDINDGTNTFIGDVLYGFTDSVTDSEIAATVPAKNNDALNDVLKSGENEIYVAAGSYKLPSGSSFSSDDTLYCLPGVVFEGSSKLNVNGATIVGANFSNPTGSTVTGTVNGTFDGCTFEGSNGLRGCYASDTTVFENCVISGDVYGIHFDGGDGKEVVFKNCTISGFNATAAALKKVTFEGCTFKGNGKSAYNGLNVWGDAAFKDCTFIFDGSSTYEWIDVCSENKTVTIDNCEFVTNKDLKDILSTRYDSDKIIIDGVEFVW